MKSRTGSRGVFVVSLGLAAGLHGAALAYALTWQRPAEIGTRVDDIVTVEIVDAAMLDDETAPAPPTDKLPSAAAKASDAVAEDDAPERQPVARRPSEKPVEAAASAAPEPGEAERETATEEPPPVVPEPTAGDRAASLDAVVEPEQLARESEDPPRTEEVPPPALSQSADPSPALPAEPAIIDTSPPAAEPRMAMIAPLEDAPAAAVAPPAATTETGPKELAMSSVANRARKPVRSLKMAALAARPIPEAMLDAPKPKAKTAPKRVAKLEPRMETPKQKSVKKAEPEAPRAEKAAKEQAAKGKRMAALAVEGEGTESGRPKPAKTKLKGNGKAGDKSGKGVTGATTSGSNALAAYKNTVRSRIFRNTGATGLGRGTNVSFALTPNGGLRYVRISRSSGNSAADQAALAAVKRSAPFPPAPRGATSDQLVYNITFKSR